jgi:hypothetical protein
MSIALLCACGDDDAPGRGPDARAAADAAADIDAARQLDGGGEPRTVTGSAIDLHITDAGEVEVPIDLSGAVVQVLVDDGAGGYLRLPGAGSADGTFTVADVPAGTYMLRVDQSYFVTDRSSIDLGQPVLGRADAVRATISPTRLRWVVDGMAAWQADDRLDFFAPNAGASYFGMNGDAATPPADSDVAVAMAVDYTEAIDPYLVDAAAGDAGYLLHFSPRGTDQVLTLTQIFQPASFTMVDGQRTRLEGSFTDVALDQSIDVDLRGSSFAAVADAVTLGMGSPWGPAITIYTSPFSIDRGDLGFISLAEYRAPDSIDRTVTIDHGHPFPPDWTPYAQVSFAALAFLAGDPYTVAFGFVGALDTVQGLTDQPAEVRLGPVENPTIEDADANQPTTAGNTPQIAWQAPSIGEAEVYVVHVRLVTADSPRGREVATFTTPATSLRIPDGILSSGAKYFLEIDARFNPGVDLVSAPFRLAGPERADARRPTEMMTIE